MPPSATLLGRSVLSSAFLPARRAPLSARHGCRARRKDGGDISDFVIALRVRPRVARTGVRRSEHSWISAKIGRAVSRPAATRRLQPCRPCWQADPTSSRCAVFRKHDILPEVPLIHFGFSKGMSGFLMMTQNDKLLYISDNAAEYMEDSLVSSPH
ncbi:uncharacterized protein LOC144148707 isoform X2 [Haemaphysalis longicornis]